MAGLSNIFGGSSSDDSQSSNQSQSSGDLVGDASSAVGLNVDSSQSNYSEDEDGNVSSQNNDNSVGLDTDTDGLLGAMGDTFQSSEESSN